MGGGGVGFIQGRSLIEGVMIFFFVIPHFGPKQQDKLCMISVILKFSRVHSWYLYIIFPYLTCSQTEKNVHI